MERYFDFGYLSIGISIVLGVFCIGKIRSYDAVKKEPVLAMVLVAIYGGMVSMALALAGYKAAGYFGFTAGWDWLWFLLFVGPLEEGSKYCGLLATSRFYKKQMTGPLDGMVYAASVALGFSLIENFLYANRGGESGYLIFFRIMLSTPVHILSTLPLGIVRYRSEAFGFKWKSLAIGMSGASLVHGLYDGLATSYALLIFPFLIILWLTAVSVFRYLNISSPFRIDIRRFMAEAEPRWKQGLECLFCGDAGDKAEFRDADLCFHHCGHCQNYLVDRDNGFRIFHRFAPEFRDLGREYLPSAEYPGFHNLYESIYFDDRRRRGYFGMEELEARLLEISERIRNQGEAKWVIRTFLKFEQPPIRLEPGEPTLGWRIGGWSLVAVGLMSTTALAAVFLRYSELPGVDPLANKDWEGKHVNLSYPAGWRLETKSDKNDSVESFVLYFKQAAAVILVYRCWEIIPKETLMEFHQKLMTDTEVETVHEDSITTWGNLAGHGLDLTVRHKSGERIFYTRFSHSGDRQSFSAMEVVSAALEARIRPDIEYIRRSLVLKSNCSAGPDTTVHVMDSSDSREMDSIFGIRRNLPRPEGNPPSK